MVFELLIVAGSIAGIGLAAWAINRLTLKDGDPSEASWSPPRRELDVEAYHAWSVKEELGDSYVLTLLHSSGHHHLDDRSVNPVYSWYGGNIFNDGSDD